MYILKKNFLYFSSSITTLCAGNSTTSCSPSFFAPLNEAIFILPGFSKLLTVCNPGARIAIYGGTAGKIEAISPQILFWKQITIAGSTMGSEKDFAEMLAFVNEKKIVPVVSKTFEMEDAQAAFDYMEQGQQFGKPVIRID